MTHTYTTNTAEETESLAASIGSRLRGSECIELSSDLGGGKTTFTRGLVAGAGSTDQVSSPTFTISKQYRAGELIIYHYDFYRLQEPGLVIEELAESIGDERAVIVIEWAQTVAHVLPVKRATVIIKRQAEADTARMITIQSDDSLDYLFEGTK